VRNDFDDALQEVRCSGCGYSLNLQGVDARHKAGHDEG
jgi:hypothetical protein